MKALLVPSTIPCSLSRIHSFSDWRRTVSSKFFDTQAFSISIEELVHPRHARCVLSRLRCNGHSLLLNSYLSKIGRIKNPFCSAYELPSQDTFHLILHCPATDYLRCSLFNDTQSLQPLVQALGELPDFWGSVFRHAPISRKGSNSNNNVIIILFFVFCRLFRYFQVVVSIKCLFLEAILKGRKESCS